MTEAMTNAMMYAHHTPTPRPTASGLGHLARFMLCKRHANLGLRPKKGSM
jgi:hypothetical protein